MVIKKKYAKSKQICRKFAKLCPPPPPLLLQLNFCHCTCVAIFIILGITKRKVMGSKLQGTPTKLQVTLTKLQVTPTKLQVTLTKLQVTLTKLQVTPTKLQVTRLKLTSLTAETNKFQLTNMLFSIHNFLKRCFECTVNGSLQMAVLTTLIIYHGNRRWSKREI